MEVVASLSQGRTAAAQRGLFTYKSVPVIFEPPCILSNDCNLKTTLKVIGVPQLCLLLKSYTFRYRARQLLNNKQTCATLIT